MACSQVLNGLIMDCTTSVGGIKEVYIANYEDVTAVTLDTENGLIDTITMANSAKFKKYQFRKQTGSMTSTLNVDEVAGINYVSTEVNLVFTKMETSKRLEMSALAVGQLAMIVKDGNNKYWYLGYNDYVSAVGGGGNSGTAKGDSNNYTITLKDESDTFPYEVDETIISGLIA
jgi:N-methylhydantoinase B/oxoprolinase/acetone carboxylase alpha subunit